MSNKRIIRNTSTRKSIEEKLQEALEKQKIGEFKNKYGMDAKSLYKALSQKRVVKGKKGENRTKLPTKPTIKSTNEILKDIVPANIPYNLENIPSWFESTGKVDVSIIIPMHKSKKEIIELIKSWDLSDDGISKEIIFVSDQCPQNSESVIIPTWGHRRKELGNRKVGKIILARTNVGFSGACNLGADHANGDYLIFLNADTIVTRNWVKPLYDTIKSNSDIGLVGNLQLKLNGDVDSAGSEWNPSNGVFEHIGNSTYKNSRLRKPFTLSDMPADLRQAGEREMVTGCCFIISKKLFNEVGKFSRRYHIGYWEDADLNMRVRSCGYKVYYQPESKIYHKGGHSGAQMHSLVKRNRDIFHETWIKTDMLKLLNKSTSKPKESVPNEDIVVYTAITNGYDTLKENQKTNDVPFVAFLDYEAESNIWQIRKANDTFSDPNRNAKIHKILPHRFFPNARYSLWIDGNIELLIPVQYLIHTYLIDADVAVFKHPDRNCIYSEADICIARNLDKEDIIKEQVNRYKSQGYPSKNGLVEATVILRRHTNVVKNFNELWWQEITNGSRRDQISFPYAARKVGLKYNYFPGNLRLDDFIMSKEGSHRKRRQIEQQ